MTTLIDGAVVALPGRPRPARRLGAVLCLVAVTATAACGSGTLTSGASTGTATGTATGTGPGGPGGQGDGSLAPVSDVPGSTARVDYTPETVSLGRDDIARTLRAVSADGATFTFAADPATSRFRAGSTMLLQGLAVRRVSAVSTQGGSTVVATTGATLGDLISTGSLQWSTTLDASSSRLVSTPPSSSSSSSSSGGGSDSGSGTSSSSATGSPASTDTTTTAQAPATAVLRGARLMDAGVGLEGKIKGYDYKFSWSPDRAKGTMTVSVQLSRGDDPSFSLNLEVTLNGMETDGNIEYSAGGLGGAGFHFKGIDGTYKVHWVAGSAKGRGDNSIFEIPAKIERPFAVGGIPLDLLIESKFVVKLGIATKNAAAEGEVSGKLGGSVGFSVDKTQVGVTDSAVDLVSDIASGGNNLALAPIGVVVALTAPYLGLGLGFIGNNLMAYVSAVVSMGWTLSAAVAGAPCTSKFVVRTVTVGVVARVLGIDIATVSNKVFSKTSKVSDPPGCA